LELLGVDFGHRRIGLARASGEGRVARPWTTLHVRGREDGIRRLIQLLRREPVDCIVMGLPLRADGSEGDAARRLRRIGGVIADRSGVPVVFQDEYASTAEARARQDRATAEGSPPARAVAVDALAATVILQDYLDRSERAR
jgi:putative Holliday junction resolvase